MRYPVITQPAAMRYILERRDGANPSISPEYRGDGADDCIDEVADVMDEVLTPFREGAYEDIKRRPEKDAVEGKLAVGLYRGIHALGPEVLTDRDFWRFLSVYHMVDFIEWRDGKKCGLASFGAGGPNPSWDCVPLRMFNRALIASRGGESLGSEDVFWGCRVAGTDLWRSHILRVLTSNAPVVVHEVLIRANRGELPTGTLRDFAKSLRRVRSNILFELLDHEDARRVVADQLALVKDVDSGVKGETVGG